MNRLFVAGGAGGSPGPPVCPQRHFRVWSRGGGGEGGVGHVTGDPDPPRGYGCVPEPLPPQRPHPRVGEGRLGDPAPIPGRGVRSWSTGAGAGGRGRGGGRGHRGEGVRPAWGRLLPLPLPLPVSFPVSLPLPPPGAFRSLGGRGDVGSPPPAAPPPLPGGDLGVFGGRPLPHLHLAPSLPELPVPPGWGRGLRGEGHQSEPLPQQTSPPFIPLPPPTPGPSFHSPPPPPGRPSPNVPLPQAPPPPSSSFGSSLLWAVPAVPAWGEGRG